MVGGRGNTATVEGVVDPKLDTWMVSDEIIGVNRLLHFIH